MNVELVPKVLLSCMKTYLLGILLPFKVTTFREKGRICELPVSLKMKVYFGVIIAINL